MPTSTNDTTSVLIPVLPPLNDGWHYQTQELPSGAVVPIPVRDPGVVEAVIAELDGGHGLTLVVAVLVAWKKIKAAWLKDTNF